MSNLIELDFAETHTAVFLRGSNLGLKLDPATKSGLSLKYDRGNKELLIDYLGKKAIIPSSNVATMVMKEVQEAAVSIQSAPKDLPGNTTGKISAQVESPIGHVFAGLGAGKK